VSSNVLVVNAGSSSLKYSLVDGETGEVSASGSVERIGEGTGRLAHTTAEGRHTVERQFANFEAAFRAALDGFDEHGPSLANAGIEAIGHRVVHGGARFAEPVLVDDALVDAVTALVPLAPLHNPANLEGIEAGRRLFPNVPQVAVFDTAFHQSMPPVAYTYAVSAQWREEYLIRRYGFHGTSHSFVTGEAARLLGKPVHETNLVVLHLGNGASATAVRGGRSVDTSMGFTPMEGLVMGTRSGDLDPAVHAHLQRELGWSMDAVDSALNRESGLKGLTGHNDFREVMALRATGDEAARLAFDIYCYRIRKYVGAYYAVLGVIDAVVFTAGVGEHNPEVRAAALDRLDRLGIEVDPARNSDPVDGARVVSTDRSQVRVLVVPTNEAWEIARQALAVVRNRAGIKR
jgi:acetate kinase